MEACLNYLNGCLILDGLNDTNIVLIPKVKKPTKMTELRPISLCSVIIQIMIKVLANRLNNVLNSVVSKPQSAFIPGQLITDNVMIAFKVEHYLKQKRQEKYRYASLKIDIAKASDRVEWSFLEKDVLKLGFAPY